MRQQNEAGFMTYTCLVCGKEWSCEILFDLKHWWTEVKAEVHMIVWHLWRFKKK